MLSCHLLCFRRNPALEQQACDRIYRLGQKRDVIIHRFLCVSTVEERILQLQKMKLDLAKNILSGFVFESVVVLL